MVSQDTHCETPRNRETYPHSWPIPTFPLTNPGASKNFVIAHYALHFVTSSFLLQLIHDAKTVVPTTVDSDG